LTGYHRPDLQRWGVAPPSWSRRRCRGWAAAMETSTARSPRTPTGQASRWTSHSTDTTRPAAEPTGSSTVSTRQNTRSRSTRFAQTAPGIQVHL